MQPAMFLSQDGTPNLKDRECDCVLLSQDYHTSQGPATDKHAAEVE
jgi:hypothetical protein